MFKALSATILAAMLLLGTTGCQNEATSPLSTPHALSKALEDMDEQACMGPPRGPLGHIAAALDLTDEQKEQIKEILEQNKPEPEDREAWKDLTPEQRKAKRQELHQTVIGEIMNVLTDEQKALAQDIMAKIKAGECPEILIDKRVEKLDALVNLTEEQEAQIKAVMLEKCKERLAKRAECKGKGMRRGRKGKHGRKHGMRKGRGEMKTLLEGILTPEQMEILKEKREACRQVRKEHMQEKQAKMRGKRLERRVDMLTKELDLTAEQQEQIKAILEAAHSGERPDCDTPEECREVRQAKMQETHSKIMEVLTEEQQEKFKEMIEQRQGKGAHGRKGRRGRRGRRG